MAASYLPSPKEIQAIVEEELTNIGGRPAETTRQRGRLFLRATVPHTRQVRPNDHVQGGVAVTTTGREISVYPYVFRPLCRSGVIMAHSLETKRIKRVESGCTPQTLARLRKRLRNLVQQCASSETLSAVTDQLRTAADAQVDAALQMSAVISRIPRRQSSLLLSQILSEFHDDEDASVYALMNAVAAVARDEDDPETKWNLEELAGGVPAIVPGTKRTKGAKGIAAPEFAAVG